MDVDRQRRGARGSVRDKSAELATPANLSTAFAAQSGRVVVEAKVLARETAGFKAIPYIYDASGNTVASISFHDGNIEQHVGDVTSIVMPFVANTWLVAPTCPATTLATDARQQRVDSDVQ